MSKTPIDFSGLVSLFDPKVAAEGAALQARTRNFDAEARYNDSKANLLTDRRKALSDDTTLAAAGYTPRQIAALRATQTDRMSDMFGGIQTDSGTQMLLNGGDPRTAGLLLGNGQALRPDAAFNEAGAKAIRDEEAASALARTIAGASVRAAADPNAVTALAPGATLVRKSDGSVVANGAPAVTSLAPGATLVNRADGSVVASGAAKPADPLKEAQAQKVVNDLIISAVGGIKDRKTGAVMGENDGTVLPLDSTQIARIQARVKQLNPSPDQIDAAVQQAASELGIDLNTKESVRGGATLFNWMGPVKGVRYRETAPSAPKAAPAASLPPAASAAQAGAITVKTQADIDNAPSGAILIVNGKPMRKP